MMKFTKDEYWKDIEKMLDVEAGFGRNLPDTLNIGEKIGKYKRKPANKTVIPKIPQLPTSLITGT